MGVGVFVAFSVGKGVGVARALDSSLVRLSACFEKGPNLTKTITKIIIKTPNTVDKILIRFIRIVFGRRYSSEILPPPY